MSERETLLSEELKSLEALVKDLLNAARVDVEVVAEVDDQRVFFNVSGPDQSLFMDGRGDTLKNISFLLKTYQEKHFPESSYEIKLDAGNLLQDREQRLRDSALEAADTLQAVGDHVELEPMNAYDRRIVHIALQDRVGLRTESVGEGHLKSIVIHYVGETEEQ